eukprot:GHVN01066850.1.p1 GENE.GHVN01066850.1~~GHVN01066850.1.p1  ORF type:complete len:1001 (-),score=117.44 GHVN01066850.1:5193-7949(-)
MGLGKTLTVLSLIVADPGRVVVPRGRQYALTATPSKMIGSLCLSSSELDAGDEVSETPDLDDLSFGDWESVPRTPNERTAAAVPPQLNKKSEYFQGPEIGTLVVCPLSVMANWSQQIAMHAPQLVVGTFHGKQREQYDVHWIADHDVVITTYDVLAEGRKKDWKSPIYQVKWHRAVLDEAHIIKNRRTNASAACFKLETDRRWCLTGTPIQNKLEDFFSLVKFLRLTPFDDWHIFKRCFLSPLKRGLPGALARFQVILRFRTLRRVKSDLEILNRDPLKGENVEGVPSNQSTITLVADATPPSTPPTASPVIPAASSTPHECRSDANEKSNSFSQPKGNLPPKILKTVKIPLNDKDQEMYLRLLSASSDRLQDIERQTDLRKFMSTALSLLLRLRLLCCSCSLLPPDLIDALQSVSSDSEDALRKAILQLGNERVTELITRLEKSSKEDECCICLNGEANCITQCAHTYHRLCLVAYLQGASRPCPLCRRTIEPSMLLEKRKPEQVGEDQQKTEKEHMSAKVMWVMSTIAPSCKHYKNESPQGDNKAYQHSLHQFKRSSRVRKVRSLVSDSESNDDSGSAVATMRKSRRMRGQFHRILSFTDESEHGDNAVSSSLDRCEQKIYEPVSLNQRIMERRKSLLVRNEPEGESEVTEEANEVLLSLTSSLRIGVANGSLDGSTKERVDQKDDEDTTSNQNNTETVANQSFSPVISSLSPAISSPSPPTASPSCPLPPPSNSESCSTSSSPSIVPEPAFYTPPSSSSSSPLSCSAYTVDSPHHKFVIFSQFTRFLNVIQKALVDQGFRFCKLDGSMHHTKRAASIEAFQKDKGIRVMLASLKAGGVGVNLTAADTVIMCDSWWNSAVEAQAVDRVHRFGQNRAVCIYSIVAEDTVEEQILELQESKGLVKNVVHLYSRVQEDD